MNYLLPYKATVGNVIKQYRSQTFYNNSLFDKQYMLKKVFKELIEYLHVDEQLQKQEINKAIARINQKQLANAQYEEAIYDWLLQETNVLIGSLYEQEVASLLMNYQLTPDFTNTVGKFINMTNYAKMKMPDLTVQSLKDGSYHAFDVKSGTIWRKQLQIKNDTSDNDNVATAADTIADNNVNTQIIKSPIWAYNTGITIKKLNELYFVFKQKIEQDLKVPVHIYVMFICYDMLTKVNLYNQAQYYQLAFNDIPNHAEKVCFVVDIEKLFIEDKTFNDADDKVIDSNSPYLLRLENEVEYSDMRNIYTNKFAIRLDSPISQTLKDFVQNALI